MTTAERRENILEILSEAAEPVAARDLAAGSGSAVRLSCRIWRLSGIPSPYHFHLPGICHAAGWGREYPGI